MHSFTSFVAWRDSFKLGAHRHKLAFYEICELIMSALRISFITGNAKKLAEVANMLKGTALDGVLVNQAIDLPELQGSCRPEFAS